MKKDIFLSIVIPCYNEIENLKHGVLDQVYSYLESLSFEWEFIISDDGSTDGSKEWIEKWLNGRENVFLLKNQHGGKPAAIYHGIAVAGGKYLLFADMDQSTPMKELAKFVPFFEQYEIIIGSRTERKNFPLYRRLGSTFFKNFRKLILLKDINDTQCGFKLFQTDLIKEIFPKLQFFQNKIEIKGWKVTSFDVELLYLAESRGQKIKEVFVEWEDRDLAKGKKRNYFKESKEMLGEILRVKWNDMRGVYRRKE